MRYAVFLILSLSVLAAPARTSPKSAEQSKWEKDLAWRYNHERETFADAGFTPIAEAQMEGRKVLRLLLRDPYGVLPSPGIEFEHFADGKVTMRVQYRGWSKPPVEIDASALAKISASDALIFAEPEFVPAESPSTPGAPASICHGWSIYLQAGYKKSAQWGPCMGMGQSNAVYDYATALLKIAIASEPQCQLTTADPFWSFQKCFGPKRELDDPQLEAQYALIREKFEGNKGADLLSAARKALSKTELSLGNQAWLDAREAIRTYRQFRHDQRESLAALMRLVSQSPNASESDKVKMRQFIDSWSQFVTSQEANYSELLQRLTEVSP